MLRMIGVVRPCIVLKRMYRFCAYTSHRSPVEVTKIDYKIRWNAIADSIYILWLKDFGANGITVFISQRL